jgi:hypothetical protein
MAVFMLQIIAAGFCVPAAVASPVSMVPQLASEMNHCKHSAMDKGVQLHSESDAVNHVCAHCDLPDLSINLDKQTFDLAHTALILQFVSLVPTVQTIVAPDFHNLSPPIRTSLYTFDLNQRFRV